MVYKCSILHSIVLILLVSRYPSFIDGKEDKVSSNKYARRNPNYSGRKLTKIPTELLRNHKNSIISLTFSMNKIQRIGKDDFPPEIGSDILYLTFYDNEITEIDEDAFVNMPNLTEINLSFNRLKRIPRLNIPSLERLDVYNNMIDELRQEDLVYYPNLVHLDLRHNYIQSTPPDLFLRNKELILLSLAHNPLRSFHEATLRGLEDFQFLYLSNTLITELPSKHGVKMLTNLYLQNTPSLFTIHKPQNFQNLKEVEVTYPYHCCAFREKRRLEVDQNVTQLCTETSTTSSPITTTPTTIDENSDFDNDTFSSFFPDSQMNPHMKKLLSELYEAFFSDPTNHTLCSTTEDLSYNPGPPIDGRYSIKCNPEPDAFNPCQDVMGTKLLRAFSWLVSIFAILGNIFQLIILFHNKEELTVYKLLMYNLGFSNLLMGIYLLVLCCVDAVTFGQYYNYVQKWQYNGGCQAFGFMALFATQLSVCSLVLITVERFLLIIYALQVSRQMQLRHAKMGILLSWMYSFLVAFLPTTNNTNSYMKTAICLPLDLSSSTAIGYVIWILLAYIIAFVAIVYCYVKMYKNINEVRPGIATRAIDIQVAKRMALIIFSNFLCWLPISIAGFMALYSDVRFNVNVAKFLLVFFFPLNACTNPFLYAIFTNVFRSDALNLLRSCGLLKRQDDGDQTSRSRAPSHYKSKNKRAESTTRHFIHIEPPVTTYTNKKVTDKVEMQTEFDSPDTPIKMKIHSKKGAACRKELEDDSKIRSESTRGLLENQRYRTESSETSSTGHYDDDVFNNMIGSVKQMEPSILHAV